MVTTKRTRKCKIDKVMEGKNGEKLVPKMARKEKYRNKTLMKQVENKEQNGRFECKEKETVRVSGKN